MSGLGYQELLLVALVALVVIGPRRLPEVMRQMGRLSATLRRAANEFRRELELAVDKEEVASPSNAGRKPIEAPTPARAVLGAIESQSAALWNSSATAPPPAGAMWPPTVASRPAPPAAITSPGDANATGTDPKPADPADE